MKIGVGVLGAGNVGGALIHRLIADRDAIAAKTGLDLELRKVAVRSLTKARWFGLPAGLVTQDSPAVIDDPEVQLVVELMGGIQPAADLIQRALQAGKAVVTANKEVIASRGPQLLAVAAEAGVPLLFEAAVGGGIPILRPLSESLAGEAIHRVTGIVNGTTNFILTQMTDADQDLVTALSQAQALGLAEADPSADLSGSDAAAKAVILASLAFGGWVDPALVYCEGIADLDAIDLRLGADLDYVMKLLAIAEESGDGISVRVHPSFLPSDHPLASVKGASNAIFVEGASVGRLLFAGAGAGGEPTATAVLGDVIDAARQLLSSSRISAPVRFAPGRVLDFGEVPTAWYLRIEVADRPGVLAQVAAAFGDCGVSIRLVWQEGRGDDATLVVVTHRTREADQRRAALALTGLEVVREVAATYRVEDEEA